MSKTLRLGIIGMGNMGNAHARLIESGSIPHLKLTAVCDRWKESLAGWEGHKDIRIFSDAHELLAADCIDALLIATPHFDHTTLGIAALEAGYHVLVEKPISAHVADCKRLIAAHHRPEQVFAAMFNQRTDPHYIRIKKLIETGELGKIQRICWTVTNWYRTQAYYDSGGWRATWAGEGGGVLLNQCPHQLDLYQWLFGMPERITAFCQIGRFHQIEVEDNVTAYLEHPGGATGVFITTTGEAPGTNRLEIAAERGRLIVDDAGISFTRNEIALSEHLATAKGGFEKPAVWNIEIPVSGTGEQHAGILKNFARACLFGDPLIAPAAEGIRSVELANTMLYSSALGQTLQLPLGSVTYENWLKKKINTSTFQKKVVKSELNDFKQSF